LGRSRFETEWLRAARKSPHEVGADDSQPAGVSWNGQEQCARPFPAKTGNVTSCYAARVPHRHCECGEVIDLEHGYCTDCLNALIRGAAMTDHQSWARKHDRLKWLERFGFIVPDLEALLRRGMNPEVEGIVDE
jgi:hypothetical protein